ncbi:GspE/PulE family protein [Pelomonas sp. Root1444]|uniref:GspE/PulE family protein n=1 Tax=Pelomonas sp. Root1444 TaxID=1736464 RepID=UPI0009E83034|nr:GspE/PulE family protein [Pelomonas sp. Root1444]
MNRETLSTAVSPSQVLAELAAVRSSDVAGTVLDALFSRRPDWPWRSLLARDAGVRCLADVGPVTLLVVETEIPVGAALLQGDVPLLAMADPWDTELFDSVGRLIGQQLEPVAATGAELSEWRVAAAGQRRPDPPPSKAPTGAASADKVVPAVVQLVDRALVGAWKLGASDVHFECDRQGLWVKHRLDGVMAAFERLDGAARAEEVISRLKVLAQLDITERRLPQDGRFRFGFDGHEVDLRVSIMPSVFGEDAVLRLLDKSTLRSSGREVTLDALGFEPDSRDRLRHLSSLPHGMVLVTGPTGSGKTTSVYAALSEINTGKEKIITIEDPVEYELPGVLQIPVNEKKGLTFARGLRSILRHDPDRILVGEIRDAETAEIAVQSALTGHLVFTTVHANSLFDVIGRFRHFRLDMFGFVSSLNGVVVQRLMRRLCANCGSRRRPTVAEERWWQRHEQEFGSLPTEVPCGKGCETCHGTGYRGRFVVAEVHQIGDLLRDRILAGAEVSELKRMAFDAVDSTGITRPLLTQAVSHVGRGQTTLEEIFRVVGQI